MTRPEASPAGHRGADAVVAIEALRCHVGGRDTLSLGPLRVHAGERVALIGPNGAGKSTLLRCLGGFVVPVEARLQVLGRTWPAPLQQARVLRRLRADIGQVQQGLHLVGRLSALENVLLGALARVPAWRSALRWFPADEVAQAQAALARVGLAHRARERSDRLSGGERQKVAIARMLVQRPRLILADEPTASLDPQAAADVCQRLVEAAAATPGVTLVTVVHNPGLLPLLADRVIGLRAGRLAFDLPVGEVDDQRLAALYGTAATGDAANGTDAADVADVADVAGAAGAFKAVKPFKAGTSAAPVILPATALPTPRPVLQATVAPLASPTRSALPPLAPARGLP